METNSLKQYIKNSFSKFIAVSVILNGYASGIGSLSIGMIGFIFFTILGFVLTLSDKYKFHFVLFLPLFFYLFITINTFIQSLQFNYGNMTLKSIFQLVKLGVIYFSTSIMSVVLINFNIMKLWMRKISIISCIYLFIQIACKYLMNITLPSLFNFGFLRPNYDIYTNSQFGRWGFRPSSFFAEPAFFAYYIILNLILNLFEDNYKNRNKLSILYTLSLFISSSSSGIYLGMIIWVLYFFSKYKSKFKIILKYIFALFLLGSSFFINEINWSAIRNLGTFGNTYGYALSKIFSISTSGRIGKSFSYLMALEKKHWLLGIGIGNEAYYIDNSDVNSNKYMNAVTSLIFWSGLVGISFFLILNLTLFLSTNNLTVKILLTIYIICGFFSGLYFSLHGIIYMMTIIILIKKELSIKKNIECLGRKIE